MQGSSSFLKELMKQRLISKMNNKFFELIREKVKGYMNCSGHDFDHVERVYNLAIKIAKKENADLDIIKTAALLHDTAREMEDKKEVSCHAEEGAKIAREILEKTDFPKEKIENVVYCIKVHRYSKGLKAETKEAMIIQDADRLDALGAVCIARMFAYGGQKKRIMHSKAIKPKETYTGESETVVNHFYEKILKIKPELFNTKFARKLAKRRYKFTEKFVKEFLLEWEGKA